MVWRCEQLWTVVLSLAQHVPHCEHVVEFDSLRPLAEMHASFQVQAAMLGLVLELQLLEKQNMKW